MVPISYIISLYFTSYFAQYLETSLVDILLWCARRIYLRERDSREDSFMDADIILHKHNITLGQQVITESITEHQEHFQSTR